METRLRRCAPGDEAALALVGGATFLETYAGFLDGADIVVHCQTKHAPEFYAAWLADPAWALWVAEAEKGGAPLGYLAMGPAASPVADPSPEDIEIHRLYVLARFQRMNLGARLMLAGLDTARGAGKKRALIGVNKENRAAQAFYLRTGFAIIGERKFMVGAIAHDDFVLARAVSP